MSGGLVFFDFDGTLTHTDSTQTFAQLLDKGTLRLKSRVISLALGAARFRMMTNHQLKVLFSRLFFRGRPTAEIREVAMRFAADYLPGLQDDSLRRRLDAHRDAGDDVHLVSANFTVLLRPLQEIWGIAGIVGTEVGTAGPTHSGTLLGRSCHGPEKVRRLREAFGRDALAAAAAYGDSRADLPLLRCVAEGYFVTRNGSGSSRLTRIHEPGR